MATSKSPICPNAWTYKMETVIELRIVVSLMLIALAFKNGREIKIIRG
jgi:hypothetical protein